MPPPLDAAQRPPSADEPLAGMTVLVVEDSRFASEAVRLLCVKSGARLRRADCLRAARRHLGVYRPDAVIVDVGLPDGSGLDLIRELDAARPRIPGLLAMSGDPDGVNAAVEAGADCALAKPVDSLATFQKALLAPMPLARRPCGPRGVPNETVTPSPVLLHDDIAYVSDLLESGEDEQVLDYAAQFLRCLAQSAHDAALADAARDISARRAEGGAIRSELARVAGVLQTRMHLPV